MGILSWIIFGAIAGWIASLLTGKKKNGCMINIIVGVVGAIIGGMLMRFFTGSIFTFGFNLYSFGVAIIGAVVLLVLVSFVSSKK